MSSVVNVSSSRRASNTTRNGSCQVVLLIAGCLAVFALMLACSCCALSVGVVAWLDQWHAAYPSDPAALTQVVQEEVVQIRGLEFKQPVALQVLTPEELRERLQEQFEEEWPPEEARKLALTLAAFDLLDPDTDVYQLYLDLYSEQIAGFYDPETKELYVVSDAERIGVLGRMTLAHELTHALQDQYYDLQAMGYGESSKTEHDSEYLSGVMGLVEGDASILQSQYMSTLSPLDWVRLGWEYSQIDLEKYNQAPKAISAGLTFPYEYGQSFVEDLYQSGGWAAVDAAFANPPQSTEQILHPQRYRQGDVPRVVTLPPLTDTLGSGWQLVDEEVLGEFYIRLHLAQHLEPDVAASVAEGWGGDRYAVYYNETQSALAMAWYTAWDDKLEAREFLEEYELYLDSVANHGPDVTHIDRSCWQAPQDYRCLMWRADTAAVVRGPDAATVLHILGVLAELP